MFTKSRELNTHIFYLTILYVDSYIFLTLLILWGISYAGSVQILVTRIPVSIKYKGEETCMHYIDKKVKYCVFWELLCNNSLLSYVIS